MDAITHAIRRPAILATGLSLRCGLLLTNAVLLERSHEVLLLGDGLESTVTEFGAGIDEFEVDLLERPSLGLNKQRLLGRGREIFG